MLLVAAGCAVGGAIDYWWTANTQLLGGLYGGSFLLVGTALVVWSHHLLPEGPYEEAYPGLESTVEAQAEVLARLDRTGTGRRTVLLGALGTVGGALAVGAVSTVRSLGPGPFSYAHTPWVGRRRLVMADGTPVKAADMPVGDVVTVCPEGFLTSPVAPAVLIHLPGGLNHPVAGRRGWAPKNFICYSKVCTHAACALSLYNAEKWQLQCPCHQSTFNVLRGAEPVFGPAGGPLPQLPLALDPKWEFRSAGDYSAPPGPVYWHYSTDRFAEGG